jgi:kynureninase
MNALTVNLHLMMISFYRPTRARYKVVIEASAFPSDRYAVASQARLHGFDPEVAVVELTPREGEATLRTEDVEAWLEEHGREVALVMLGGVNYYTGQAFDLARITAAARRAGAAVGYDLAHAAGNLALRLHDWGPDFAVWCTYKYLNAGPGGVAGCFVHARHRLDASLPRLAGWWGNDPAQRFGMPREFAPQAGAAGWQLSNAPVLPMAALRASLELFSEAGMGALRAKSEAMSALLFSMLEGLPASRLEVITPRDPAARGCQVSLRAPSGGRAMFEALQRAGMVCDFREPDVIRAAPVPLYNRFEDVWRFAQVVRAVALGQEVAG